MRPKKHLKATVHNFESFGLGNCFQRSVALVMDHPKAQLVVGTMTNRDTGEDYIHCWVEIDDVDYDPARIEPTDREFDPYERDIYRRSEQARDIRVIDRPWVMAFAEEGQLSEWMLTLDDTPHTFERSLGAELLTRIGYPHRVGVNEAIETI